MQGTGEVGHSEEIFAANKTPPGVIKPRDLMKICPIMSYVFIVSSLNFSTKKIDQLPAVCNSLRKLILAKLDIFILMQQV